MTIVILNYMLDLKLSLKSIKKLIFSLSFFLLKLTKSEDRQKKINK